jgi:glyoxylase-like metal-dependent hydrolase (beta-lactamase superfamily II)/rhodanese-related sulfurtransferase
MAMKTPKYTVDQIYTKCLSQMAYFVVSGNEAAVIDPLRDTEIFLKMAEEKGVKIKYIFETHFHADFVSGHLDLREKTGAEIIYGPGAEASFPFYTARDGEEFNLGDIRLKIIHTPGHTLESISILLEQDGNPEAVFTGDALFSGDVGRPDLAVNRDITEEYLAGLLFDSLKKLKQLPGNVIVYPGHGEGSACGKNIGPELISTIGFEKRNNLLFSLEDKNAFVKNLTEGLPVPPKYFFIDAKINKSGYESLKDFMKKYKRMLSPDTFHRKAVTGKYQILDARPRYEVLQTGIIPGSLQIGLDESFAVWSGALLDFENPLLIVAPENRIDETLIRLARVGFDNVEGVLSGGIANWTVQGKSLQKINHVSAVELLEMEKDFEILDVRPALFFDAKHCKNAIHIDLMELNDKLHLLDKNKKYLVHCQTGYRGMIAMSLLLKNGFSPEKTYYLNSSFEELEKIFASKNKKVVELI